LTNYLSNKSLLFAAKQLSKNDGELSFIFETDGVPPLWARRPGFATLIKIILEQQVSLSSAKAINEKLHKNIKPFTPARLLELGISNFCHVVKGWDNSGITYNQGVLMVDFHKLFQLHLLLFFVCLHL